MTQFKKFEIGKRYGMNSACDQDCWWYYTVIARTECTVTLQDEDGKIIKCRMNSKRNQIWGCEAVRPLGSYSMCPTLTADRECPEPQPEPVDEEAVSADEPKAEIIALNPQPKAVMTEQEVEKMVYQLTEQKCQPAFDKMAGFKRCEQLYNMLAEESAELAGAFKNMCFLSLVLHPEWS